MSVRITSVDKGSPADKARIKAGESLVSINGNAIHDILDYQFYASDKKLVIELEDKTVKVRKGEYDDLGLNFETYLMDCKQHCKNNCVFCFINQLPKGMRETLYFKDDDSRLSFLQGNYITMTNLSDEDVDRIIKMKLPMNISVHTTNPELRVKLTKNPNAGKCLDYLYKMAAAVIKGLQSSGVSGTIKHFACNNQEYRRNDAETVVSERALRELYLKGFAIALRESGAFSIMTTYGPVNGLWTSSNYDLLTTILRQEWGYHGVVMTDWWAKGNQEGKDGSQQEVAAMIRSQNDLYMVTSGAENNGNGDNLHVSLEAGTLTIGELQRSAANICRAILRLPAYRRLVGEESAEEQEAADALTPEETAMQEMTVVRMQQECTLPSKCLCGCRRGEYRMFHILAEQIGCYELSFDVRAQSQNDVAQLSMTIYRNRSLMQTISLKGSDRSWRSVTVDLGMIWQPNFYLKWFFSMGGIEVQNAAVRRTKNEKEMQV